MDPIVFPTFDFSEVLDILSGAISAVAMPAVPYLIGAAALTGIVGWVVRRGSRAARLK